MFSGLPLCLVAHSKGVLLNQSDSLLLVWGPILMGKCLAP